MSYLSSFSGLFVCTFWLFVFVVVVVLKAVSEARRRKFCFHILMWQKEIVSPQCCCCQQTLQLTFLRKGKFLLGRGWKRMLRECELCGLLTPSSWKVRRSVIHSTCKGNCLLTLRFRKAYSLSAYCSNPEWKERREYLLLNSFNR